MSFVIGRGSDAETTQAGYLGRYRALDGSEGAELHIDLDGPHAMLIVGKRGYGKSFTMGVVAEELARAPGVAPTIIDPMGVFSTLAEPAEGEPVPVEVVDEPAVSAATLDPRSWCSLLGLSPESGAGGLVWQAAQETRTLDEMRRHIEATDAPDTDKRAATNHVNLADSWGVFDPDGLDANDLASTAISVVDVSGLDAAPMNAVCRGIGEALYRARVDETIDRLPWLLIDEAHTFFDGVSESALHTILTRGRAPGVSLVLATQRPSSVSDTAISQSDVLISHRLTAEADLAALDSAQPTYMNESLDERLPTEPGEVVVIDDATETIHAAQIRFRDTPHGGGSPSAREMADLD
ncbi:ATP-binding protein [Halopiger djelfimassiliensis]|uniref:ATP-binding protein n=1 Tax=Halopiger djelfimassiliensis TaxID=1293047 RepID=UPI000677A133|nr:ATP-binding protein [Halopiger djelfimassiliensis]